MSELGHGVEKAFPSGDIDVPGGALGAIASVADEPHEHPLTAPGDLDKSDIQGINKHA